MTSTIPATGTMFVVTVNVWWSLYPGFTNKTIDVPAGSVLIYMGAPRRNKRLEGTYHAFIYRDLIIYTFCMDIQSIFDDEYSSCILKPLALDANSSKDEIEH